MEGVESVAVPVDSAREAFISFHVTVISLFFHQHSTICMKIEQKSINFNSHRQFSSNTQSCVPRHAASHAAQLDHLVPPRALEGGEAAARALPVPVHPSPATHAIWTRLKAGDLLDRVQKTLLDTT